MSQRGITPPVAGADTQAPERPASESDSSLLQRVCAHREQRPARAVPPLTDSAAFLCLLPRVRQCP